MPFSLNLILYPRSVASETAFQDISRKALNPIVAPALLSIPAVTVPVDGADGAVTSAVRLATVVADLSVLKEDSIPDLETALNFTKYVAPVPTDMTFVPADLNESPALTYDSP